MKRLIKNTKKALLATIALGAMIDISQASSLDIFSAIRDRGQVAADDYNATPSTSAVQPPIELTRVIDDAEWDEYHYEFTNIYGVTQTIGANDSRVFIVGNDSENFYIRINPEEELRAEQAEDENLQDSAPNVIDVSQFQQALSQTNLVSTQSNSRAEQQRLEAEAARVAREQQHQEEIRRERERQEAINNAEEGQGINSVEIMPILSAQQRISLFENSSNNSPASSPRGLFQDAAEEEKTSAENNSAEEVLALGRPVRSLNMNNFAGLNSIIGGGEGEDERGMNNNEVARTERTGFANIAAIFGRPRPDFTNRFAQQQDVESLESLRQRKEGLQSSADNKRARLVNLTNNNGINVVGEGQQMRIVEALPIPPAPPAPTPPIRISTANNNSANRPVGIAALMSELTNNIAVDAERDITDPIGLRPQQDNNQPHAASDYQARLQAFLAEEEGRTFDDWMAHVREQQQEDDNSSDAENSDAAPNPSQFLQNQLAEEEAERLRQEEIAEQLQQRREEAELRRQQNQARWAAARIENEQIARQRVAEMSNRGRPAQDEEAEDSTISSEDERATLLSSISELEDSISDIECRIALVEEHLRQEAGQQIIAEDSQTSDSEPRQTSAHQTVPNNDELIFVEELENIRREQLALEAKEEIIKSVHNVIKDREDQETIIASYHQELIQQRQNILSNIALFNHSALAAGDDEEYPQLEKGAWVLGLYSFSSQKASKNSNPYKNKSQSFAVGFDAEIIEDFTLGTSYGYSQSMLKYGNDGRKYNIDSHVTSLYGQNNTKRFIFSHNLNLGINLVKSKSKLGDGSVKTYNAYIYNNVAYKARLANDLALLPNMGIGYTYFNDGKFTETGANNYKLNISAKKSNQLSADIGAKLVKIIKLDNGLSFLPEIHAKLAHNSSFGKRAINANISYLGQQIIKPITINSNKKKSLINLGAVLQVDYNNINVDLSYNCNLSNGYIQNSGLLRLKLNF